MYVLEHVCMSLHMYNLSVWAGIGIGLACPEEAVGVPAVGGVVVDEHLADLRFGLNHMFRGVQLVLRDVPRIFIVRGPYVRVSSVLQQELEHLARVVKHGDAYARPTFQISGVYIGSKYLRLYTQLVAVVG